MEGITRLLWHPILGDGYGRLAIGLAGGRVTSTQTNLEAYGHVIEA